MFANNTLIHSIEDIKKYYIDNPDINVNTVSVYDSDVHSDTMYDNLIFMYNKCASSLYDDSEFQTAEKTKFKAKFNISQISIRRDYCFGKDNTVASYDIDIYVKFITPIDNKIELPEFGKLMSLKDIIEWKKSLPKDKQYLIRIDDIKNSTIIEDATCCFDDCHPDEIDAIGNAIGQFTIKAIHINDFQILICVDIESRSKYLHHINFY